MERSEIEQVLANWIAQATSGDGQLADGIDPAEWIATNFVKWWRPMVDDSLSDAEGAAHRIREELNHLGGWENKELGEVKSVNRSWLAFRFSTSIPSFAITGVPTSTPLVRQPGYLGRYRI